MNFTAFVSSLCSWNSSVRLLSMGAILAMGACPRDQHYHHAMSPEPAATESDGEARRAPEPEVDVREPQPSTAFLYARSQYTRRIGVVIGINNYRSLPKLTAAVPDAARMADLMRDMGYDEVEQLMDREATLAAILDLFERRIPMIARDRDLVTIYFAGHGMTVRGMGFVVPVDGDKRRPETAISVQRLKESALRMRARHVLYLMDACFSGTMFRRRHTGDDTNDLAFWEAAAKQRVVQVLTAGGPNEMVLESDGWGSF